MLCCLCVCCVVYVYVVLWLVQPSSGRREKGSGGKSSGEKGRTKTYLMASHRKKREQMVANNLESDEVDPEIQVCLCLCVCIRM